MDKPMNKYMRTGIIFSMAFPMVARGEGPIIENMKKILTDEYFNAIEITWIKDDTIRKEVKKMLETAHMSVTFGAHPMLLTTGLNINSLDENVRTQALTLLKEGIDEAYEIGAEAFTFLSGKYEKESLEEAYQKLVISTGELCSYAKKKGEVKILLEVFDHDIDKKSLIGPANLALRLAETVSCTNSNFGLTVDLSHIPLIKESYREAILPITKYLEHVHLGNCVMRDSSMPAYGDNHPRFGFPGGENDVLQLTDFLRILLEIGFLNEKNPPIVNFEVKPYGDEDPDIVIASSKRTLALAWARL